MRRPLLVDRCLPEPGQPRQQLVARQAVASSCSVNVFQVRGAKVSWGPFGCLLSRTATARSAVPTSTQAPAVAAAVATCAPRAAGHVHRSSATFLIRSREAAHDSACARSLSNEGAT